MKTIYFAWNPKADRFDQIDQYTFEHVKDHESVFYVNNTIIARKESDDDTSVWTFDVYFGNATGNVISALCDAVEEVQGAFVR